MTALITLENLSKTFTDQRGRRLHVLDKISLEIRAGEIFVFLGPSGSGKSTILRLMSGLDKDFHGIITNSPDLRSEDMAFVFQQFAILPWLTVFENIELWLLARNLPLAERHRRIKDVLAKMKLEEAAKFYPWQLSGGMRQRVGLARALAIKPKIMFLDEPFSELDSFTANALRQELLDIWRQEKLTIVLVSHIIGEAIELADRIAVLSAHPARIEKIITNPLPRPRQKRSPEFFQLEDELYKLVEP